jgi:hypothetical protein
MNSWKWIYSSRTVGSVALPYNHELVDPCDKDFIQFFAGNAVQQFLQTIEQIFFVDHLDIFQFFFDCRKQAKITGCQIWWVGRVFGPYHLTPTDVDFGYPAHVCRAVIQVKGWPFRMEPSSGWEHLLFKSRKNIYTEMVTLYCCASQEFIDNMESKCIPYHCKHGFFVWMSRLGFVATSSLVKFHIRHGK